MAKRAYSIRNSRIRMCDRNEVIHDTEYAQSHGFHCRNCRPDVISPGGIEEQQYVVLMTEFGNAVLHSPLRANRARWLSVAVRTPTLIRAGGDDLQLVAQHPKSSVRAENQPSK